MIWSVVPILTSVALLATGTKVNPEYCNVVPLRCFMSYVGYGVGGLLIFAPFIAAITGIWFLFSKKRQRLPLVAGWTLLVLVILIQVISGQASFS